MVAHLLSFAAICPLTDRRKTGCKSELFLKNPKNICGGFFGGVSRKRRVWGGNPNKYLTGGQMSKKRNLVHWSILALALALALASLYIDNTKPICYNIAKKNSHVVLISVSEVFIWQTAKTETSLLTALWAL